jgi:2-dehydropantoate 2-reductase
MKVCVYGAGVIGGILASACARAGHEVSVIARGAHLDAIRANGLTVVTPEDRMTSRVGASADARDFGVQDLVIVATKTPAFFDVARGIAPLIGPQTLVGFAVNGVFWFYGDGFSPPGVKIDMRRLDPEGLLHRVIGAERSLGIVCWGGGEIHEPGVIEATRAGGRFVVGAAMPQTNARTKTLVETLDVKDVTLEFTDDVRAPMWVKNISVIGNFAMCALTGGTIGQVHADAPLYNALVDLNSETHAIALAHGFTQLGFDAEKSRQNPGKSPHKPSMLQDLERGRSMEISSTFLIAQDLARQAGLKTPVLDVIAPLVAARARNAGLWSE